MMSPTSACFPYPYQYWLHAGAEEVSVSQCNTHTQHLDKPGCSLPGSQAAAQQSPRCVGREAPELSHRLSQSSVRSDSCKAPLPCPNASSWLSGEHLGQVTRAGPAQSRQRCGASRAPSFPPSLLPSIPTAPPPQPGRIKAKKKRKRETHSLRLIPSTDLP